ncbi:MAG: hypothetical protein LPK26_04675 [Bacillaceae bacterium]|nr:hypothetical protein [Bacillaceae bacterium]
MEMSIVHQYASTYGWTRDYILESVYLDEHFILKEMIEEEKRQNYLMLSHIQLLPHLEDKDRKQFIESLSSSESVNDRLIDKEIQTDFEAIERARQQFKNMN